MGRFEPQACRHAPTLLPLNVTAAGEGAERALSVAGAGRVLGSTSSALYVHVAGRPAALTSPAVPLSPVHARLAQQPPRVAAGAPVHVADRQLRIDGACADLSTLRPWRGSLPAPRDVVAHAEVIVRAVEKEADSSALWADGDVLARTLAHVCSADLGAAAQGLGGRGPGLTPAGDDVLSGLLFVLRAGRGQPAEAGLERLADLVPTTSLSRAYLSWAARGQALEPAHDVLMAATRDLGESTQAARRLAAVGHSSGADICLGLLWGAQSLVGGRASG
jgi:hypothetical protein